MLLLMLSIRFMQDLPDTCKDKTEPVLFFDNGSQGLEDTEKEAHVFGMCLL